MMNKQRKVLNDVSFSQIAGHLSFIMATTAFAATDMLDLRCLAIGATSFSMIFQYYRPTPLKIPLKWNTLLLGINCYMASCLYFERKQAQNMDETMLQVYKDGAFEKRGFSRVEFCKLFSISIKRTLNGGETLITGGKENKKMYFVASGSVRVRSDSKQIAVIDENGFVGEMSFLDVLTETPCPLSTEKECTLSLATADVVVDSNGATVYEWDFEELLNYLKLEHEVANALQTFISHDLREKLKASNVNLITLL